MSNAADLVVTTFGGKTFKCSRRTEAHLAWTHDRLTDLGGTMRVYQGCYNTGVKASAGTHDYDAVIDVDDLGLGWEQAQRFLRECGWAAWWRNSGSWADPSKWHIHAVSLGYPGQVGVYVPGQVSDYYAHRSGLVGHVADPSWFPPDIDSTIFDYAAWEAALPLNKDDLTAIRETVDASVAPIANRIGDLERLVKKKAENSWNRDKESRKLLVTVLKQMVENGADLDELVAYVEKHGQPDQ